MYNKFKINRPAIGARYPLYGRFAPLVGQDAHVQRLLFLAYSK